MKPRRTSRARPSAAAVLRTRIAAVERELADLSKRETLLREGEARFRSLFDNASDSILTFGLDGTITSANRAFELLTGWTAEELIGRNWQMLIAPEDRERMDERTRRALAGEKLPSLFEVLGLCKDGRAVPFEGRARAVRDRDGNRIGFIGVYRDISERRQAEAALRESEERYRALFQEAEEARQVLDRLYRVAGSMQTSWERDDRIRAFIQGVHEVLGFDRFYVALASPDGTRLEVAAGAGVEMFQPVPLTPAAGPLWQAFQTRRPVLVLTDEDLRQIPTIESATRDQPYFRSRRFLVMPLVVGDRAIGIASADNKTTRRPITRTSVELFTLLCQHLAIALEEARLYAETRAREQEVTRLYEVTALLATSLDLDGILDLIVDNALKLIGCDAAGVCEYSEARGGLTFIRTRGLDPEIGERTLLRPGEGVTGKVYAERRPLWVGDLSADAAQRYSDPGLVQRILTTRVGGTLGVPIMSRGEVFGVLNVYFFSPHDFTTREIQLVSALADHAAIAVENARLFRALEDKTRQLEVASRHKSEFLAHMSHELRTPLNAIIGYSEMLQEEAVELRAPRLVQDLTKISAAGHHLLELINAVLDLSKIEAGKMDLYLQEFDVAALVGDIAAVAEPLAAKNGNRLDVRCHEDVGRMRADLTKARQALFNLVSNACKFTRQGAVSLAATRRTTQKGDAIVFTVSDTGIGITPEQMSRLFQEFSQADPSIARAYGGTGLGLALSRRLCRLMGGDVSATSEPGRGSTFTITLPATVMAAGMESSPGRAPEP